LNCQGGKFLIESEALSHSQEQQKQKTLLKLELYARNARFKQKTDEDVAILSFNLEVTIRLCRLLYMNFSDIKSLSEDIKFYRLPSFNTYAILLED